MAESERDNREQSEPMAIPNRDVRDNLAESAEPAPEHRPLTAEDFRDELQEPLGLTDDELSQLPIVYGSELVAGDVYFDLDHPDRGEFRASEEAAINPGGHYIPKQGTPEAVWYRVATSLGYGEIPSGNAAPASGAYGEPNPDQTHASHGGFGSPSLGKEELEMEEEMEEGEQG